LAKQGLFLDEGWSWAISQMTAIDIAKYILIDPHPPLYYLMLKGILAFLPHSEVNIRILSVLGSTLTIAILILYVRRWWSIQSAIYVGILLALSSFDIYYAQEARMYSIFALFWLLAFVLFMEAVRTKRYWLLILWGIVNAILPWIHFFGIFVAGVGILIGLLILLFKSKFPWLDIKRYSWLVIGTIISILGLLPITFVIWSHKSIGAGGAWVPYPVDLIYLLSLVSTGFIASSDHFLDKIHLVLPITGKIPYWGWWAFAIVLLGFAYLAIILAWKRGFYFKLEVIYSILLILIPLSFSFIYGNIFRIRVWAYKPFLGAAYIFYMWVGIGISQLSSIILRRSLLILISLISLFSLIPYFTTWQKTNANLAFEFVSRVDLSKNAVLIEPAYIAPLAFYYTGEESLILGFDGISDTSTMIVEISDEISFLGNSESIGCTSKEVSSITNIWAYGNIEKIENLWDQLPTCWQEKNLWLFSNDEWIRR
jgi:uncharacterized membrane protein